VCDGEVLPFFAVFENCPADS